MVSGWADLAEPEAQPDPAPGPPVWAGVDGECALLGGLLGAVHSHAHLLAGVLIGILHHQDIAAWPRHHYLKLDIHLGEDSMARGSQSLFPTSVLGAC